jgi:hypothetical protein
MNANEARELRASYLQKKNEQIERDRASFSPEAWFEREAVPVIRSIATLGGNHAAILNKQSWPGFDPQKCVAYCGALGYHASSSSGVIHISWETER